MTLESIYAIILLLLTVMAILSAAVGAYLLGEIVYFKIKKRGIPPVSGTSLNLTVLIGIVSCLACLKVHGLYVEQRGMRDAVRQHDSQVEPLPHAARSTSNN